MRVLASGLAVMIAAGAACADETVRIGGGQGLVLPGTDTMVTVTDVQDQRCPSGVDCYWEGMIRVELTTADGAVTVLCNLCEGAGRSGHVAGRVVSLTGLEPGREVLDPLGRPIVLADYAVVLAVE